MEVALVKCKEKSISEAMKADGTRLVETHGAFGFPWMVVHPSDGEVACFFGSDRFPNMAWWYVLSRVMQVNTDHEFKFQARSRISLDGTGST
jgi:hypothetical protein